VLSSFRKPGKIPEVEPVEAAVFLGIPFRRILRTMLGVMQKKGAAGRQRRGVVRNFPGIRGRVDPCQGSGAGLRRYYGCDDETI
jgi:hypothetical protein